MLTPSLLYLMQLLFILQIVADALCLQFDPRSRADRADIGLSLSASIRVIRGFCKDSVMHLRGYMLQYQRSRRHNARYEVL